MEKEKFERKKRNRRELASPEMFRQMQKKGVAETVSNVKVTTTMTNTELTYYFLGHAQHGRG